MTLLQAYALAYPAPALAQITHQSAGLTPRARELITRLSAYQPPERLVYAPVSALPPALRYFYLDPQTAVLFHITPRAEGGFTHALAGPPEALTVQPPILSYGSRFWATSELLAEDDLPPLERFSTSGTLRSEALWPFLNFGQRREWLASLIAGVIDYHQTRRKLIVIDTPENIALWVYALTLALPPRYRRWLTFSSYQSQPTESPFLFNGVTPEDGLVFGHGEYLTHCILNTETRQISAVPASDYAQFVAQNLTEDGYRTDLEAGLYPLIERRDPFAYAITVYLNDLTSFYLATVRQSLPASAPQTARALNAVLTGLEQQATMRDVEDARAIYDLLETELVKTQDESLVPDYLRALVLLKRLDREVAATGLGAFYIYALLTLHRSVPLAGEVFSTLRLVYGPALVPDAINTPDVLSAIIKRLKPDDLTPFTRFWQYLGIYLRFHESNRPLLDGALTRTFVALAQHGGTDPVHVRPEAAPLLTALVELGAKFPEQRTYLLEAAHGFAGARVVFDWLYYGTVERLALKQRQPFRDTWWPHPEHPHLYRYELQRDLLQATSAADAVQTLENWAFTVSSERQHDLLADGLDVLWGMETIEPRALANRLLAHTLFTPMLTDHWRDQLTRGWLNSAHITLPDAESLPLYERFATDADIEPPQRAVAVAALAMARKQLDAAAGDLIHSRLIHLAADAYAAETTTLVRQLLTPKADLSTQVQLVRAVYVYPQREAFWSAYWERLNRLLLEDEASAFVAQALGVWFDHADQFDQDRVYAVPDFVLRLCLWLPRLPDFRDWPRVAEAFTAALQEQRWFDLIRDYVPKARKGLLGGLLKR